MIKLDACPIMQGSQFVIGSRALNIACERDVTKKKHFNHKTTGVNNCLRNACDERSISFINHTDNIKAANDLNLPEIFGVSY